MGLKEYRQKRDFSRSREPRGKGAAVGGAGYLYVIQKHAATRLHYDFRLELGGVLKSWAVPKGPSLDPAEKRLAVQVEDHPLEYGSFEGIIPKGEYGGGTVMLWDRGTWEPEGDPDHDLAGGKLAFTLHGEKLCGSWALAQMKDREGQPTKNWLLIKHKDAEAVAESRYSVVQAKPLSVATSRSLDEIAAGARSVSPSEAGSKPDPAELINSREAPQPEIFKPQLATLVDTPPGGEGWLHEIKLDGYRILAVIKADRITLLTRHGKDWTARFPELAKAMQSLPVRQAIADGEIVVLRPDGTSDFQALQEYLKGGVGKPVCYLFDLPHCNGFDLTRTPLAERKKLLHVLLAQMPPQIEMIRFSDHIESKGGEVYHEVCNLAAEGIVSKLAASPYEQKRSGSWLKTKCLNRQELVIGGWTEPAGSRSGFGALLVGYYDQQELVYAGRVGTGFNEKALGRLAGKLRQIEQVDSPFRLAPTGTDARGVLHWVRPELVAEVEFREWTRENLLRQAVFKGLREDKSPRGIVRETPISGPERAGLSPWAGPPSLSYRKQSAAAVVVAGVRVTHPDKILYPEQGVTKHALAEFYAAVADYMLPQVSHRPLTLLRCPEGRLGECFYQKHLEAVPETLRTIPIRDGETTEQYVVIDEVQGLISLVQLGVLEIHPWGSREDDLERPDLLTFDLDPGPGLGWPEVIEGARFLRRLLERLGLVSFVKTSGGKGLHLVTPIEPSVGWKEAKAFARLVAWEAARQRPERFTAEMEKAKRQGRIFIDYLRNSRGATTVAAYSTRAGAGAPVSTPIRWDELNRTVTPDRYRIDNLPKRLAALKNDPWSDFFEVRQSIPGLEGAFPGLMNP